MIFIYKIPFARIKFLNAGINHKKFFDKIFFKTRDSSENKFKIDISFNKINKDNIKLFLDKDAVSDGKNFFVKDTKGNLAQVNFHEFKGESIKIKVDPDYDLYYLFYFIIEPLIIVWSASNGILYLHASGISDKKKKASLFVSWRTTGKTNRILDLIQKGCYFVGDDFCIVKDRKVYLNPKSINLFSYNLRAYPEIFKKIPLSTAIRLRFAYAAKQFLLTLSRWCSGPLSKVFYRISELAEASTNIKVKPTDVGLKVVQESSLDKLSFLQKSNSYKNVLIDEERSVQKMKQIIFYELDDFFNIYSKFCYLLPERAGQIDAFEETYERVARKEIANQKIIVSYIK